MNIVDALVVTFGIDASEYEKKQKEIATSLTKMGEVSGKQTKLIAESAKKAAGAFSALKIEVLGAIAAYGLGDGIKGFIESNVTGNAALARQAAALKMSASDLKAWGYAAQSVGGKADDATNALQSVAAGFAEARNKGTSPLIQASWRYGFAVSEDPVQTLLSLSRRMTEAAKKYGPQQALQIADAAGVSNWNAKQMLMLGPDRLQQLVAHYRKKTGHVDTKDAVAFQGTLTDIHADVGNLRDDLFGKMAPAMEVFAKKFEAFLDKITPKLEALVERFANWLASIDWNKVAKQVEELFEKLQQIIKALGGVKGILIEIAAIKVFGWIASIAGWVIQLRALTTALTAARAAATVGGAAGAAAGIPGGAAGGKGFFSKLLGGSLLLRSLWTAAWAPRPDESPEQFKARVDAQNKKFNAAHPGYEQSSYWDKWKMVLGIASSPATHAVMSASGTIDRNAPESLFSKLEKQNGLPSGLLSSIYSAESSRGKNLVSPKGALGPFQFMPGTAADYGLHGKDVFDLNKSASAAASYLHNLMKMFNGNLQDAVAAYNWGPGNVMRKGLSSMPKETSDYLRRVLGSASPGGRFGASAAAKSTTSTSTVTINGPINVQTKATDANGVAKGMKKALLNNPLIAGYATMQA